MNMYLTEGGKGDKPALFIVSLLSCVYDDALDSGLSSVGWSAGSQECYNVFLGKMLNSHSAALHPGA